MISALEGSTLKKPRNYLLLIVGDTGHRLQELDFQGVETRWFSGPAELLEHAREAGARACVLCPGALNEVLDEGTFMDRLWEAAPFLDVIAWMPGAEAETVRSVLLSGVRDVVLEEDLQELSRRIGGIVERQQYLPRLLAHQQQIEDFGAFEGMLSRSAKMRELFELCVRTAATDATVLILGETGTGKELMARAFHRRSGRDGRLISLNCSAVPENLIDSELFGYVRGAFTGAEEEKGGLFRAADGGTLFLDEVGSLPLQVQYRLLRVLQEGLVRPVGSDREVKVDVRVIAATSVRLDEAVAADRFRQDLLFRLDVIRVVVPPLRERPEDTMFLFGYFLRKLSRRHRLTPPEVDDRFLDVLQAYSWPGNVRQLENLTERMLLTCQGRQTLTAGDFEALAAPPSDRGTENVEIPERLLDLRRGLREVVNEVVDRVEEAYLRAALERNRGRVIATAQMAGISRRTLLRKLGRLGIDRKAYRRGYSERR